MKTLLIIAYYFPPSGGPGVQRVLKYVKYLPQFGIKPIVLTVENGDFPVRDESLMKEIPNDVKVVRTPIFEPYTLYRKLTGKAPGTPVDVNNIPKTGEKKGFNESAADFIRSNFFIPDARMFWQLTAVREGIKVIKTHQVDAIYSSSPPYTAALIARKLSKKSGLPWIAGFRDPWRGFLSAPNRSGIAEMIDTYFERSVYQECDRMEVAWKGIAKDFQAKYPKINSEKVIHIENGFDEADIPSLDSPRNQVFTITYTGSMYGKRTPEKFLNAIEKLIQEKKIEIEKIKLRFVGRFGSEIHRYFENPIYHSAIEVKQYVPHHESIKLLLASDALLLIVDETEGSNEIVPGKVYEYIGTSRPIITIAPEGAISTLIKETESGWVGAPDDPEKIQSGILKLYQDFYSGKKLWNGNPQEIQKYTRRESTRKLSELIFEVCRNR
ncbi:MAG: glycosyltransferase [Chloroherpetonaceae bacterium]|nr:glycosyltransferase [Chloroherpetonaceae bacterium]